MEILIKENGYVLFLIEFNGDYESRADFIVREVISWDMDKNVLEDMVYLRGFIKWDGCSHIWFGDSEGYLHLCGKDYFDRHKMVIDAIWDLCSSRIVGWDG